MKSLVIGCLLLCSLSVQAQNIKSLFIASPDSLAPLLTEVNRADFGDFLLNNMKAEVKNRFGKSSEMIKMTEDYLQLKMTSVSSVEMKLLPVNDTTNVICVVHTYNGPVVDSNVKFYSTEWKELPLVNYFQYPDKDEFYIDPVNTEKKDSLNQLKEMLDMYLLKIKLSADNKNMYLTFMTPEFLDKETQKRYQSFLYRDPICYNWENGQFIRK